MPTPTHVWCFLLCLCTNLVYIHTLRKSIFWPYDPREFKDALIILFKDVSYCNVLQLTLELPWTYKPFLKKLTRRNLPLPPINTFNPFSKTKTSKNSPVCDRTWIWRALSLPKTLWQKRHLCLKKGSSLAYCDLSRTEDTGNTEMSAKTILLSTSIAKQ